MRVIYIYIIPTYFSTIYSTHLLLYLCERIRGNSPAMLTAILDFEWSDECTTILFIIKITIFFNEFVKQMIFIFIIKILTRIS